MNKELFLNEIHEGTIYTNKELIEIGKAILLFTDIHDQDRYTDEELAEKLQPRHPYWHFERLIKEAEEAEKILKEKKDV